MASTDIDGGTDGDPVFRVWPVERIGPMNGYFGSGR